MSTIHQPISALKGVGAEVAKKFHRLDIFLLRDLLFHLPFRYQDRTHLSLIAEVQPGDTVVIEGQVVRKEIAITKKNARKTLLIYLQDATGICCLRYFNFHKGMEDQFSQGNWLRCFGEIKANFQTLEMVHPETRMIDQANTEINEPNVIPIEERLTPIYPLTSGFTQKQMRGFIGQALNKINEFNILELLPIKSGALSITQALHYLHMPPANADQAKLSAKQHPAQLRLAMEEMIAHQLCLLRLRKTIQKDQTQALLAQPYQNHIHLNHDVKNYKAVFLSQLPFSLTHARQKVIAEIEQDIAKPQPMLRLVQGDVGAGKTVVAAVILLHAIQAGFQAAMMAPTEILAEQHAKNLSKWCEPLNINVVFLSGALKGKARVECLKQIANGKAQIIVGTHALFQDAVEYAALNLVIIDEQHRFGVDQRLKLKTKGKGVLNPHQLMMTATPIPRTLAMTAYADLDLSIIDELPPNRTPIITSLLNESRRDQLIERLLVVIEKGQQAYWVCTLIEESEALEAMNATETLELLQAKLPNARIGLIHGRLKAAEKEVIMREFKTHQLDILVATTVIEVGVDVPNASLMVIENSERLGLSQLHQLRGRVGRGAAESYCVLLFKTPLSHIGKARLSTMKETADGFKIAEKDLELRGPGEVLGTRQTGAASFKIADLGIHGHLVARAKHVSDGMIQNAPDDLIDNLIYRWIGNSEKYGSV